MMIYRADGGTARRPRITRRSSGRQAAEALACNSLNGHGVIAILLGRSYPWFVTTRSRSADHPLGTSRAYPLLDYARLPGVLASMISDTPQIAVH